MKKLIALAALAMLSSCAQYAPEAVSTFIPESAGPPPENYKAIVRAHIERTYFDPYSLRSVAISAPHKGVSGARSGYWVCVECNGKNRMGAYAGLKRTGYLVANGSVVDSADTAFPCYSEPYNVMQAWPEMEGK